MYYNYLHMIDRRDRSLLVFAIHRSTNIVPSEIATIYR